MTVHSRTSKCNIAPYLPQQALHPVAASNETVKGFGTLLITHSQQHSLHAVAAEHFVNRLFTADHPNGRSSFFHCTSLIVTEPSALSRLQLQFDMRSVHALVLQLDRLHNCEQSANEGHCSKF
jgi:hypothetical protein